MEEQLHRPHGRDYHDPLHPADVHGEEERGAETRSAMKKVKEKVDKLEATIKHGRGGEHKNQAQTVNDSPAVRSGLVEPTDMGTPVLAEDLYAPHSDIVDTPVRSFAQWEEEERHGAPPPLSTDYETHLTDRPHVDHHTYDQAVNTEQLKGSIGKPTGLGEATYSPNTTPTVSPANLQSDVTDTTNTSEKEVGITDVLRSFDKMKVFHEHEAESLEPDQNEQKVYTGSHDQFAPEPVENPPLHTDSEHPCNQSSSYTQKLSSATSAIAHKAAEVKDSIVSKMSSPKTNKKSSFPTDFSHKVADTLSSTLGPVYEKVAGDGSPAEGKGVAVKEYLVDAFKPGDDDKVLSEVITHAFNRGKGNGPQRETSTTTYVEREGERRLQDSALKFADLAPPTTEALTSIPAVLRIPKEERIFRSEITVSPATSQTSENMSADLRLDDLESFIEKKGKVVVEAPKLPLVISKPNQSSSKKRGALETTGPSFEALDFSNVKPLFLQALDHLLNVHEKITHELQEKIDDLVTITEAKNKVMRKEVEELARLKQECKDLKASHAREMEAYKASLKVSAALAICQAKVKIIKQTYDASFDKASWDLEGLRARILELEVEKGQNLEQEKGDESKTEKAKGGQGADEKAKVV